MYFWVHFVLPLLVVIQKQKIWKDVHFIFFLLILQEKTLAYFSQQHIETRESGTASEQKEASALKFVFDGQCYIWP